MTRDDCIFLGTIAKTHGVRGELILRKADPAPDPEENRESIFLLIDGILVPFFISSLRPFRPGEWILEVDWYGDRNRAEKLVGYQVWIPRTSKETEHPQAYPDELSGYSFRDARSGAKGLILGFMDIPENPVFEVETDGEKKLVPASDEMILEVDTRKRMVVFELPEGLF